MEPPITRKFVGRMVSMPPRDRLLRPQLLMLLFVLALIGPAACNIDYGSSEVNDAMSSGQVGSMASATRGIKAALIHRNHYSLRDDAKRSQKSSRSVHHSLRNQRRLVENASNRSRLLAGQLVNWETPVSVDPSFEYNMNISLGTPPQNFVVEVDTGSDLAWVQCLPGQTYYNDTDGAFDPSKSSTYANLSCASSACEFLSEDNWCEYSSSAVEGSECTYEYTYGTGATNGTLVEETLYIGILEGGTQSMSKFQFGCGQNATADFGVADGLFGLGRGNISFPAQLGRYFGNVFSYCLVNSSRNENETSPLIFGDAALSATATNGSRLQLEYTPMINHTVDDTFYYVDLENITVDGVAVPIPRETFAVAENGTGGFILDSGTTYTYLLDEAFNPLVETLKSAITHYKPLNFSDSDEVGNFELCYNATWELWASEHGKAVPTVSFKFGNAATFDLGVGNLWKDVSSVYGAPLVCIAIFRESGNIFPNIFGNWQQADHYIVYDLEKQQIGFATTVCGN